MRGEMSAYADFGRTLHVGNFKCCFKRATVIELIDERCDVLCREREIARELRIWSNVSDVGQGPRCLDDIFNLMLRFLVYGYVEGIVGPIGDRGRHVPKVFRLIEKQFWCHSGTDQQDRIFRQGLGYPPGKVGVWSERRTLIVCEVIRIRSRRHERGVEPMFIERSFPFSTEGFDMVSEAGPIEVQVNSY